MYYKTPDNSVHFLENESFAYLLPNGSVQITEAEANETAYLQFLQHTNYRAQPSSLRALSLLTVTRW